ncbi:response regulator [Rhodothermus profundi]|uniref:Phosphate regulon transcriptional regulatory protein PhoB n=1 Tax=Rhodothermus profundi TaxID=633813 RepID=A0A1M6RIA4_9BACT|nr:response regulator transcription factor [Rhodothermus profundi]SHK32160.1 two-component system, OmpR family, alkaline phosphatase synthesis response regulator PhoP [Rhodothermus profundi]
MSPTAFNERPPRVLIVDDEEDILTLLAYNFQREGFEVVLARDGEEALAKAAQVQPDVIILDIMMPNLDGIEVCRRIRRDARLRTTPVLMLTARTEEEDQIQGLDVGADMYVGKPVSVPVLLSQTRALLRGARRYERPPDLLRIHDLEIDRDRYLVYRLTPNGREALRLPRKEFELLYFLAAHPGKVFTRQQLLDEVWGRDVYVVDRTVDVHIRKIREKLGSHYIETVKGVGYKFRE